MRYHESVYDIINLSRCDALEAARLYARVYFGDPSVQAFSEGLPQQTKDRLLESYFKILVDLALNFGVLLGVKIDSKLVAVRIFYQPKQYPVPLLASFKSSIRLAVLMIPSIGLKKFLKLAKLVSELEKGHPREAHFYSEITCVDPNYQKRGIAKALTEYLFKLADESKYGIYIETSNPVNVPIWGKLGYEVISEKNILGTRYWAMWRKVNG